MNTGHPLAVARRQAGAIGAAITLTLGLGATLVTSQAAADPLTDVITIGHRGSAGLAPENTEAAVELAHEHDPEFVEIDVQLSSDGVPVMMHDSTLARTTNVEEVFPDRAGDRVHTFSYDELMQLDAGSWYSTAFAGEKIPTLEEILDAAYPDLGVVIELKEPAFSPGLVDVVVDELASDPRWDELADDGRLMTISFDVDALFEFHEARPDIPVMPLGAVPASDSTLASIAEWADGLGTNYRTLDPGDITRVHDAGLRLNVYTVNSPEHMNYVRDLGVDMITTDFPGVLTDLLAGRDPLPAANGIVITDVLADAPGDDIQPENGEYLVLTNTTSKPMNVSEYFINDAVINRLVVDRGYVLQPGGDLRVYTGPGTNSRDPRDARYYNDYGAAVLNNGGDSLALFNRNGELVDLYAY